MRQLNLVMEAWEVFDLLKRTMDIAQANQHNPMSVACTVCSNCIIISRGGETILTARSDVTSGNIWHVEFDADACNGRALQAVDPIIVRTKKIRDRNDRLGINNIPISQGLSNGSLGSDQPSP